MKGGEKEQMGKWAARLSFLLVIALFCFLCVGSATADSYTYTLSGGLSPETLLVVDDDLEVRVNEKIVFIDNDKVSTYDGRATWNGTPIPFSASPGEVLRIIATNPGGIDVELSPLYLHVNGQSLKLSDGVPNTRSNESDFFDESFTISLPPPLVSIVDFSPSPVHGGEDLTINVSWENVPTGWKVVVSLEESELNYTRLADDVSKQVSSSGEETFKLKVYPTAETHTEAKVCACFYNEKEELKILDKKPIIVYPNPQVSIISYSPSPVHGGEDLMVNVSWENVPTGWKLVVSLEESDLNCTRLADDVSKKVSGSGVETFTLGVYPTTGTHTEAKVCACLYNEKGEWTDIFDKKAMTVEHTTTISWYILIIALITLIIVGTGIFVVRRKKHVKPDITKAVGAIKGEGVKEPKVPEQEDVKENLKEAYPEIVAARLANIFRIVQEIRNDYCNTTATVRDINRQFDLLKMYLEERAFLEEVESIQRRLNAELREDERLDERHVEEVTAFCERFTEMWIARFSR